MQEEQMIEKKSQRPRVFISYSHEDARYLKELHKQLDHYAFSKQLEYWDDTKIPAGSRWRDELQNALKATTVAILLVSADFLASRFIVKNELPPLLKAARQDGATILCIVLRPCAFTDSELDVFQSVNPPNEPLSLMSKGKRETVWAELARLIKNSVQHKLVEGQQ